MFILKRGAGPYEEYPILAVTAHGVLGEPVDLNWQNSSCVRIYISLLFFHSLQ
jgi:hypothetical protein